jgi:hypothetical protein
MPLGANATHPLLPPALKILAGVLALSPQFALATVLLSSAFKGLKVSPRLTELGEISREYSR